MRRVLVAALLLAGILCLGQQPRAQLGMTGIGAGGFGVAAPPSGSAWGDHGTNVFLSTTTITDDTATGLASSFSSVRGTQAYSTGLHYFEVKALTAPLTPLFIPGVMDDTTANGAPMDNNQLPDSAGHSMFNGNFFGAGADYNGVSLGAGFSLADNDILGFALDQTNGFYYLALNNVWFLSGDPTSGALGTGAVGNGPMAGARPMLSVWGASNGIYQLITTDAAFTYAKPIGYSAWNYLLKRDINPAANDNTPLGLNQVA